MNCASIPVERIPGQIVIDLKLNGKISTSFPSQQLLGGDSVVSQSGFPIFSVQYWLAS